MLFIDSPYCKPQSRHCVRCRDTTQQGSEWRKVALVVIGGNVCDMPTGFPNFECPHNVPWGFKLDTFPTQDIDVNYDAERDKDDGRCCS